MVIVVVFANNMLLYTNKNVKLDLFVHNDYGTLLSDILAGYQIY